MFYIDDVKLCCVLCMWKENRCKDYSAIDFIWDFTKQRGTLSCWCEEVLYWFSEVRWWNGQEDWRSHWEHSKRHVQESWWKKEGEEEGKGRAQECLKWKWGSTAEGNWSSWEKHVNTAECQTKMISKGRNAAANCWSWTLCEFYGRGEVDCREEVSCDGDDGTVVTYLKVVWNSNGRETLFHKEIVQWSVLSQ